MQSSNGNMESPKPIMLSSYANKEGSARFANGINDISGLLWTTITKPERFVDCFVGIATSTMESLEIRRGD